MTPDTYDRATTFAISLPPLRRRPDEVHVKWDRTAWEMTFWAYHDDGTTHAVSRRAQDVPRFVPLAGRLALRWMRQVGDGLTARQIALCYAAAEAAEDAATLDPAWIAAGESERAREHASPYGA